ncbi:MAG TPA: PAAR domain-containing protein [Methanocella sp.]|nr:PAAR domain-containing protein [Methanocella sp.]
MSGSATVFINKKPAARAGDTANTCNDPTGVAPVGKVVAVSQIMIG